MTLPYIPFRRKFHQWYGSPTLAQKILGTYPSDLIALWKLDEPSGTTVLNYSGAGSALNAVHSGTVTVAQENLRGVLYPTYGGGHTNFYSAAFDTAYNEQFMTFAAWIKPSTASLTDGVIRTCLGLGADSSNRFRLFKTATNNNFSFQYTVAGVSTTTTRTITTLTSQWQHIAITMNIAGNEFKAYLNGVQQGATMIGAVAWASSVLGSGVCTFGALNTANTTPWAGSIALPAFWNRILTAPELLYLAA